ncbi:MAG: EAL domain-containing protein [Sulfuricurvum sp.]|nr:EAL domain-containing protein [Sulfuricurvum sp.]
MNHLAKMSLSYKIVGSLILIFLLISISLGVIIGVIFENMSLVSEKQKADLLLQTVEKPLQMTLYLKLYDQIEQKVSSAIAIEDVMKLTVRDENNHLLYRYSKPDQQARSNQPTVTLSHDINEPITGELMGSVSVSYKDLSHDEMRRSIQNILYAIAISVTVIFFIAVWWVRYLLSPLTKIAQKVRSYELGKPIIFDNGGSQEIEQIALAFTKMQETTQKHLHQIESMNSSLEITVKQKTLELEKQYYFDRLTGLPNRYRLQEILMSGKHTALAILNLDDFKEVNDFFGITIGDEVLIQIGSWLKEISDNCYRLGGDEFALVFYDLVNQDELEHRLSLLIKLLEEKTFLVHEESLNIRVSIGVAMGNEKVLTRADIALHFAKENKKQIAFYNQVEGMEEQYRLNLTMASSIRKALFDHRIICHYQPIHNLHTGSIEKYETLVRMVDEDNHLIAPLLFLPIAKQTKLYPQITLEVIYQACTLFAARTEEFSVNLSDSDIRNPHTVSEIIKIITATGTASRIVFEILESEGIESFDEVSRFIAQVKTLGAKIAIDDFGTGYSNFENILKLNVDYIKIDGSLIREINVNERHRIIVETIIDFAQKINAQTIAEFVTDEETYTTLRDLHVDYSQGYFTGKPEPLA